MHPEGYPCLVGWLVFTFLLHLITFVVFQQTRRVCGFMVSYRPLCRDFFQPMNLLWHTVWTDGSGRHSSNPHCRRCGVGYVTDTGERSWLALPGCRQSVLRAELLASVRALEECQPRARRALPQACQLHWVNAHQTRQAVDEGRITLEDFQGNLEADE
eukprot:83219-Amphidinium_carterae.1